MSYNSRLYEYVAVNAGFGIHYDKRFKKEYLPSRVRYNQFFFYTGLFTMGYYMLSKNRGGSRFCPR